MTKTIPIPSALTMILAVSLSVAPDPLWAQCDSLDGPLVKAARNALETRQIALVLPWVLERDETEIRVAFDTTLAVRDLSAPARALADRYFFVTVVRVHRAAEREPYTGLQPAGRDLGPAIPAAEQAIRERSAEPLVEFLSGSMAIGVLGRLQDVVAAENYQPGDLRAARGYVKAYTEFIRYVDRLYEAIAASEADPIGEPDAERRY